MTLRKHKTGAVWSAITLGLTLGGGLAGCGGGGSNGVWVDSSGKPVTSTPTPATPSPTPAGTVPDYYLPAVTSANTATVAALVGVNPLATDAPAFSASLSDLQGAPGSVHTVAAYSLDPTSSVYGYLGESRAYFVNAGRIYRADLRGSASQSPVQLSRVTDACYVEHQYRGTAAGLDNWIGVVQAGADGNCATSADNLFAVVRDSYSATVAPSYFPTGTMHVESVTDGTGKALGFVDLVSGSFKYYNWSSQLIGDVDGGSGGGFWGFSWLGELAGQNLVYLLVNGNTTSVRALSYTATGASLGASVYNFASGKHPESLPHLGGSDYAWFADGAKLLRLRSGANAAAVATLSGGGSIVDLGATSKYIVLRYRATDGSDTVWSLPKAGGKLVQLDLPWTAANGGSDPRALDAVGDTLIATRKLASGLSDVVAIEADGSNPRTLAAGVVPAGVLRPLAASPLDTPIDGPGYGVNERFRAPAAPDVAHSLGGQLGAVLFCQPAAGRTDCAGAALTQLDPASAVSTALGTLPTVTGGTLAVSAAGSVGQPFTLVGLRASGAATLRDVYLATGGSAGSLKVVKQN
ncbi:hypothetical protein [Derxia lacustris]|uniref:hypothetical protein n=1 Tax=Derxia lacustris TaxID=764842 RepID=UPI000A170E79|nr:hypothetical protein [Derxia lacustris]